MFGFSHHRNARNVRSSHRSQLSCKVTSFSMHMPTFPSTSKVNASPCQIKQVIYLLILNWCPWWVCIVQYYGYNAWRQDSLERFFFTMVFIDSDILLLYKFIRTRMLYMLLLVYIYLLSKCVYSFLFWGDTEINIYTRIQCVCEKVVILIFNFGHKKICNVNRSWASMRKDFIRNVCKGFRP